METLLADLRYSVRSLRNSPGFTIIACLTLALGIGSATAIFSVVNAVLLRPLPFLEPDRLIHVGTTLTGGGETSGEASMLHFTRLHTSADTIERVAGTYRYDFALFDLEEQPVKTDVYLVTEGYLELLGARMHLGRSWTSEEHVPGSPGSLVLSYPFWRDVYGADPTIVGGSVPSPGGPVAVIGVAGPDFDYPRGADGWSNLALPAEFEAHMLDAYARLKPGVTIEQARADFNPVMDKILEDFTAFPQSPDRVFVLTPLREYLLGDMSAALTILLGATGTLLLIACANVSNLQLSRGAARAREIAIRSALGAQKGRVIRQLLTESVLLGTVAGIGGIGLAALAVQALLRVAPSDLPRIDEVTINTSVLLFALGSALVAGVLFGLAPALRLASTDLRSILQEESRGSSSGPGRNRAFAALTALQVALAVVLVIGAGLLSLSFENLRNGDLGFDADNVLTLSVSLLAPTYSSNDVEVAGAIRTFRERVGELGGVASVGAATTIPLGHTADFILEWAVVGGTDPEGIDLMTREISPGFAEALRILLVSGRNIDDDDGMFSAPVALINETGARRLFPGEDPLGRHVSLPGPVGGSNAPLGMIPRPEVEIVGVVTDIQYRWIGRPASPEIYLPLAQAPYRKVHFAIRTTGATPLALVLPLREAIHQLDRTLPLEFDTLHGVVDALTAQERFTAQLLSIFAFAALALATVGIYGVISYSVGQRSGEMAIRKSLGAAHGDIIKLVMRQGMTIAAIGTVSGVAAAWALRRVVAAQLHEVSANDPRIFIGVTVTLVVVAAIATYFPARRATRVHPSAVLRND